MLFEISTTREFAAAHQLRLYDRGLEPLHGHNWRVKVTVAAERLDAIGVVMDFHELERQLDAVLAPLHNRHLNELPAFAPPEGLNPSAENVALHVGQALRVGQATASEGSTSALPAGVRLVSVEVWETATNSAVFRP